MNGGERFAALERLYGSEALPNLAGFHICVVGIGGVGSWAVEALARNGVGEITMIDWDTVAEGNCNRQIHAVTETMTQKKIHAMEQRIISINPGCRVHGIDDFITLDNLQAYLTRGYHFVIDAIDSIKFKCGMIYYCKRNKIPIITTGGAGGCSDPSHIKVGDLSRTVNDPLAAKVRSMLRYRYGYTKNPKRRFGIECVYSTQQRVYPKADGSVGQEKPGIAGVSLDCRFGYGSCSMVTGSFGFTAAARVINKLLAKS